MPSLYIIFVAGGFLPPIFYLYYIIGETEEVITIIWLVHFILYSLINFVISFIVIELFIYKKYGPDKSTSKTFIVIAVLIMASFLPIYSIGTQWVNITDAYKLAGRISYLPWGKK